MKPTDPKPDDDDDLLPLSPEDEATMQAEIDLALEPYGAIAPASLLPTLRANLEHALRTHPYPRQLLRGFAQRKPVAASGDAPIDGSTAHDEKASGKTGA